MLLKKEMSVRPFLPGTFCASVQKARKLRAAWRHAGSATPLTKGLPRAYGPLPRVRAISPPPASPWRESSGTESSSAAAPSGGIPPANSEWLILRRFSTRGRLLLAKAVEPHDLTATRGLVGVPLPPRSPRFRVGGRRAPPRWSASWPCAPPAGAPRHGPCPRERARPLARTLGLPLGLLLELPLGLRRPPFLRTAGQTAPKDRRSLSPPRRARPTAPARRRTTRRPRSRSRSPRDPRTGAAGRRSSPWDIARACEATGARPRRGCRRKYRNDARPADRSWRCP